MQRKKLSKEDTIKVNFEIINNGDREGSEVVQLYVENGGVKKLKDFKRIFLNKNESFSSILKVPISELRVWDENTERYVINSEHIQLIWAQIVKNSFFLRPSK